MKAWTLDPHEHTLACIERPLPAVRAGSVRVRMHAAPLLSYLGAYVRGEMPAHYLYPSRPFTVGTNGVGRIEAIGEGVLHFAAGAAVAVHPYLAVAENVESPAEVLTGLTAMGPRARALLEAWPDGTLAEYVDVPASLLVPLDGLDALPWARRAVLGKFSVPFGGLRRGRLAAGETVVINGAGGYFGSAAALLALAMGAERVVVAARRSEALQPLVEVDPGRVHAVVLAGDAGADAAALREAAGGGAHLAYDMVGRAADPSSTLAALGALHRRGRLVLMGSMHVPLPLDYAQVLANQWEILGHFMYAPEDLRRLVGLVRGGLLDLQRVRLRSFGFDRLPAAMDAAASMSGLDATVLEMPA